jgi:hypothetical protein
MVLLVLIPQIKPKLSEHCLGDILYSAGSGGDGGDACVEEKGAARFF